MLKNISANVTTGNVNLRLVSYFQGLYSGSFYKLYDLTV